MLSRCDRVIVLKLPGWENSKGVEAEIACAKKLEIPIEWMEFNEGMYEGTTETGWKGIRIRLTHPFASKLLD